MAGQVPGGPQRRLKLSDPRAGSFQVPFSQSPGRGLPLARGLLTLRYLRRVLGVPQCVCLLPRCAPALDALPRLLHLPGILGMLADPVLPSPLGPERFARLVFGLGHLTLRCLEVGGGAYHGGRDALGVSGLVDLGELPEIRCFPLVLAVGDAP